MNPITSQISAPTLPAGCQHGVCERCTICFFCDVGLPANETDITAGLSASEPFPILHDTDWLSEDLQAPDTALTLSAPASRVVTTGAFPVTSQGPANFQTGLSAPQQQQWSGYSSAQQAVAGQNAAMSQQNFSMQMPAFQPQSPSLQSLRPAPQPQSHTQAPDQILDTLDKALTGNDIPADVKAQLMEAYMANKSTNSSNAQMDSQPSWQQQQFLDSRTASEQAAYAAMLNGPIDNVPRSFSNTHNNMSGAAWDLSQSLQHPRFGVQQASQLQGSGNRSAPFAAAQAPVQASRAPANHTHMGQSFQGMPSAPQVNRQRPSYGALMENGGLQHSGAGLAVRQAQDMLQRNSAQPLQNQAHASMLQQQGQPVNHRQGGTAQANALAPGGSLQALSQPASIPPVAPASASASLFEAWSLADLASPQQMPQSNGSPMGSGNLQPDLFNVGPADQARGSSGLSASLLPDRRSLSPQTSQGLVPGQAPFAAAGPALTRDQLLAAQQAQHAQQPRQAMPGLPDGGQLLPGQPRAVPLRAGPPPQGDRRQPARGPQHANALPQQPLPALYQSNSQQSSDASCGLGGPLGGPTYSSQFLPLASQASFYSLSVLHSSIQAT